MHHPTSELWRLRARSGGRLQWYAVESAGGEPFPRSRHVFCGVPARQICLLSGGRSVKANTVLNDLWALSLTLSLSLSLALALALTLTLTRRTPC